MLESSTTADKILSKALAIGILGADIAGGMNSTSPEDWEGDK